MKKVSVVIPCFNQGKYLSDAIMSVLAQSYGNIEIICINDASTDMSEQIMKNYSEQYPNISFINNVRNKGVVYSRNIAISSASGEYILPLDADDKIEPTYIEEAVKILEENLKIGVVYCKAKNFGIDTNEWKLPEYDKQKIVYQNRIFSCAMFRKSDFLKLGGYKNDFSEGYEDWDLWLTFIEAGFDVYRIDKYLFHRRKVAEKNRSKMNYSVRNNLYKMLVKHHTALYCDTNDFVERVFHNNFSKYKKYKKLTFVFVSIAVFELTMILGLLVFLILKI